MLDVEHHIQWQRELGGKNAYALNKNNSLQLWNFPVEILIKVTQKSIFPSNHTFIILLIGRIWAPMSVPN